MQNDMEPNSKAETVKCHPLHGRKQSPEHIAARIAARRSKYPKWSSPEGAERTRLASLGVPKSEEMKRKLSIAVTGFRHTPEARKKIGDACRGEKCHLWRGGISANNEKEKIRKSLEYKLWREAVYKRDNWTCVFCRVRGVKLEADHIKPFSTHPELRLSIDNGRTLCKPCHKETDTYGVNARWVTRN